MFFLQASHVIGQVMEQAAKLESSLGGGPAEEHDEVYVCLWAGCKVRGKTSCSKSWLEKHVPTHGGKFNFACMVGGCKQRFTSQVRQSESNLGSNALGALLLRRSQQRSLIARRVGLFTGHGGGERAKNSGQTIPPSAFLVHSPFFFPWSEAGLIFDGGLIAGEGGEGQGKGGSNLDVGFTTKSLVSRDK